MALDWNGIAGRIRGLIHVRSPADIPAIASRLGVEEQSLRATVAGRAPLPTPAVISALVRVYGLDPSWVLTGEYDPATHRAALESERAALDALVRRMIAEQASGPTRDVARRQYPDAEV